MKSKFFAIFFVAFAAMMMGMVSLTSCSKDDDKTEQPGKLAELKTLILGKWVLIEQKTVDGGSVTSNVKRRTIEYKADGKVVVTTVYRDKEDDEPEVNEMAWRVSEDNKGLHLVQGKAKYNVIEITDHVFVLAIKSVVLKFAKIE